MRFIAGYTQLESLVEGAIGDKPEPAAVERLTIAVTENLEKADKAVHTALRNAILTTGFFELLTRASVAELTLAGLRIADLGIVQRMSPLLVAFFFYQAMLALATRRLFADVYKQSLQYLHPNTSVSELSYFMNPFSTMGAESLLLSLHHGKVGLAANRLGFVSAISVLVGLPALTVYSMIRNWGVFGTPDWLSLGVIAGSLLLLSRGFLALVVLTRALRESEASSLT